MKGIDDRIQEGLDRMHERQDRINGRGQKRQDRTGLMGKDKTRQD